MLPIGKIDDGSLKICKVEISRSRRETETVEKTSRVVGGTNIKECFQKFFCGFKEKGLIGFKNHIKDESEKSRISP